MYSHMEGVADFHTLYIEDGDGRSPCKSEAIVADICILINASCHHRCTGPAAATLHHQAWQLLRCLHWHAAFGFLQTGFCLLWLNIVCSKGNSVPFICPQCSSFLNFYSEVSTGNSKLQLGKLEKLAVFFPLSPSLCTSVFYFLH